jgi:HSF-type DNA-binding
MCVTNTTGRRYQPLSFSASQLSVLQKTVHSDAALSSLPSSDHNIVATVEIFDTCPSNHVEKVIPKRRRKPQKPGKTAKNNDRHFVVHHYQDHALDVDNGDNSYHHGGDESSSSEECHHRRRGGVSVAFPVKLHEVLDQVEADGFAHVISWQCHGRCFMIHKPKEFVDYIMPRYDSFR